MGIINDIKSWFGRQISSIKTSTQAYHQTELLALETKFRFNSKKLIFEVDELELVFSIGGTPALFKSMLLTTGIENFVQDHDVMPQTQHAFLCLL